jgi:predicted Zn-ribbon and HTH transcriptional regulator
MKKSLWWSDTLWETLIRLWMHSCSCYVKKNCCCGDFMDTWCLEIILQFLSIHSNITFAFKQASSYGELGPCEHLIFLIHFVCAWSRKPMIAWTSFFLLLIRCCLLRRDQKRKLTYIDDLLLIKKQQKKKNAYIWSIGWWRCNECGAQYENEVTKSASIQAPKFLSRRTQQLALQHY